MVENVKRSRFDLHLPVLSFSIRNLKFASILVPYPVFYPNSLLFCE